MCAYLWCTYRISSASVIISLNLLSQKCVVSSPKDISLSLVWHPNTWSPNYAWLPQSVCTGRTLRGKIWQVISSNILFPASRKHNSIEWLLWRRLAMYLGTSCVVQHFWGKFVGMYVLYDLVLCVVIQLSNSAVQWYNVTFIVLYAICGLQFFYFM